MARRSAVAEVDANVGVIEVPLGELDPTANSNPIHIDLQLTRQQSASLRRILKGLQAKDATCQTPRGRRLVDSRHDVIRYLLEQV